MVGWLSWLSPRKKRNFSGSVPAYGPMWQAQQAREDAMVREEQARRARYEANIQAIDDRLRRVRNEEQERVRRNRLNSNARMAAELQAAENAHSAMQLSHANSLPRSNTLPPAASLGRPTWNQASFDPMTHLWDEAVQHSHEKYERNTSKQIDLDKRELGRNSLANNVSVKDPFTLETVNPDQAVYLATNLPPGSRKVQQLYDWEGIQGLLQQPQAVSPLTRKIFTEDDVKRVEASAVRNVIARMR